MSYLVLMEVHWKEIGILWWLSGPSIASTEQWDFLSIVARGEGLKAWLIRPRMRRRGLTGLVLPPSLLSFL